MSTASSDDNLLDRSRRRRLALCAIAGLFGAPGAWLLQVMLSETLAARACYGASAPYATPAVGQMTAWLWSIAALALAIAVTCAVLAAHGLRFLTASLERFESASRDDARDDPMYGRLEHRDVAWPSGQVQVIRRKRFLALCSTLIGCGFVVGLLFTVPVQFFLNTCSQWH